MADPVRPAPTSETSVRLPAQARWSTRVAAGARIRNARVAAGLAATAVARDLTTPAYLSRVESGERWPSRRLLDGISRAVGVRAEDLTPSGSVALDGLQFELTHADLLLGAGQYADAAQVSSDLGEVARSLKSTLVVDAARSVQVRALLALGDTRAARVALRSIGAGASVLSLVTEAGLLRAERRFEDVVAVGRAIAAGLSDRSQLSWPEEADLAVTLCESLAAVGREGTAAHVARVALRHLEIEGAVEAPDAEGLQSVVARALSYRSFDQLVRNAEGDVAAMHAARLTRDAERLRRFAAPRRRGSGNLGRRMAI